MKILMVTPYYFPVMGGTEIFIKAISSKLNERGFQADIMTLDLNRSVTTSTRQTMDGLNVIKVPTISFPKYVDHIGQSIMAWHIPIGFTNKLREYDVVHFHNDADLSLPLFSYFVKKPKVLHCHCMEVNFTYFKTFPMARWILRNVANTYIAISNHVATLLEGLGIPRTRVKTILNGVDTVKFKPAAEKATNNVLLFVGRLDPIKGLHVLLKSLDFLDRPVHLEIIGPTSWNHRYSMKILNLIEEANKKTTHKVTYLGEKKPDEMVEWYQKASMLVSPDTNGISGLTSLEALACGTPIVATGNEIVKSGFNGVIVQPNDSLRLAQGISYLLENNDVRKKLGEKGRKYVVENFSVENVVSRLIKTYRELIG